MEAALAQPQRRFSLRRSAMITASLIIAFLVAGQVFMLSIGILVEVPRATGIASTFSGVFGNFGVTFIFGVMYGVTGMIVFSIPVLAFIIWTEVRWKQSPWPYAIMGGIVGVLAMFLATIERAERNVLYDSMPYLCGSLAGAMFYWYLAGRNAGRA